jgi:hypothetical protein
MVDVVDLLDVLANRWGSQMTHNVLGPGSLNEAYP